MEEYVTIIFIVLFNEKQLPLTSTKINPSFLVLYLNHKITEKILRSWKWPLNILLGLKAKNMRDKKYD